MKIIDTHLHMWELNNEQYPWNPLGKIAPDYAWTAAMGIDVLNQNGIDGGVLVQPSMYAFDNRFILSAAKEFDQLRLIGLVDPVAVDIDRTVGVLMDSGVLGFRISPLMRPDIDWYRPAFWEAVNRRNGIITLLITLDQLDDATTIIEKNPDVKVIVDHMAHPESEIGPGTEKFRNLLSWSKYPNVYIKVSALSAMTTEPYPYYDMQNYFKAIYFTYGANRLIWGTDTPISTKAENVECEINVAKMMMADFPSADQERIFGGTAITLFKF